MVRIVSDTSTLDSPAEAQAAGFAVSPLSVTIGGSSYREFEEIRPTEFVSLIHQGNMPTSSQPSIGAVAEVYEASLREALPGAEFELYQLSPAFITQGGPGCVAVQYIQE